MRKHTATALDFHGDRTPNGQRLAAEDEHRAKRGKPPLNRREAALFYLMLSLRLDPRLGVLAKVTGIDRGTLREVVRGRHEPTRGTLAAIAMGMGRPVIEVERIFEISVDDAPASAGESGEPTEGPEAS